MSPSDGMVDQSKNLEPQMNADERKWRITHQRSCAFICGSKFLLALTPSKAAANREAGGNSKCDCPATSPEFLDGRRGSMITAQCRIAGEVRNIQGVMVGAAGNRRSAPWRACLPRQPPHPPPSCRTICGPGALGTAFRRCRKRSERAGCRYGCTTQRTRQTRWGGSGRQPTATDAGADGRIHKKDLNINGSSFDYSFRSQWDRFGFF
jgi:hypothetical protein